MAKKTLLSWSSGKDSAWALHQLQQNSAYEVVGLFTTVSETYQRVAMHGVRIELLRQQANIIGLPLTLISLPTPCTNTQYEERMRKFIEHAQRQGIECMAFGDLLLEDIRDYRIQQLAAYPIEAVFPLWGLATDTLPITMLEAGVEAIITCLDPKRMPAGFAGQKLSKEILAALPIDTDLSGERGEYHTLVINGPMMKSPLSVKVGETVARDNLLFTDVLLQSR